MTFWSTSLIDDTIWCVAEAVSSTDVKSVSVCRVTSSIDATISSIEEDVSSEDAERASTLSVILRTPLLSLSTDW